MNKVQVYQLDGKEVHMVGDYVGVVWHTTNKRVLSEDNDGLIYTTLVPVRNDDPYIDFLCIRKYNDGSYYEYEYSPVDSGLSLLDAIQMADELNQAIEYFKKITA